MLKMQVRGVLASSASCNSERATDICVGKAYGTQSIPLFDESIDIVFATSLNRPIFSLARHDSRPQKGSIAPMASGKNISGLGELTFAISFWFGFMSTNPV